MNIGDGLTIQTRSIGGKVTKGIFLLPQDKPQTKKNFKSQNQKFPKNQEVTGKSKFERPKINVPRPRKKPVKIDDDILFVTNQEPTKDRKDVESRNKSQTQLKNPKNEKPKTELPKQKPLATRNRNQNGSNNNKSKRPIKSPAEQIKVDTSFVTLTQDQLNTILSLVKTKQDIDVAQIINKEAMPQNEDKNNQNEDTEDKKENEEGEVHNEPSAVPGLDLDEPTENVEVMQKAAGKSRTNSAKSNKGAKPDDPKTSRSKMFDTIGGIGSRERDRDMLEQKRRQWVKDLNEQVNSKNSKKLESTKTSKVEKEKEEPANKPPQGGGKEKVKHSSAPPSAKEKTRRSGINVDEIHEDLPSAIRSSFFLGEAAPRDHAFSAKKKQQQQRWREDLDKQLEEQKTRQAASKKRFSEVESPDEGMWARHFDTMKPQQDRNESRLATHSPNTRLSLEVPNPDPINPTNPTNPINQDANSNLRSLDEDLSPRANHLRTMTSLLDPAQIDAIELRRQKQQEHRRAITEQVEERKRMKREEDNRRKYEEMQEEKRMEEDRLRIQSQFEREKSKQHAMEEQREKQTQQLYHQMQEAKTSALKEKLEKREQTLRNRGHDTSRLEKAHMNTLHSQLPIQHPSDRDVKVPTLDIHDLHSVSQHSILASTSSIQMNRAPVSLVTSNNGPIKLEISVNQSSPRNVVEASSQTDLPRKRNDKYIQIVSDSDETEYLPLPFPSGRRNNVRNDEDHHAQYNEYARHPDHDRSRYDDHARSYDDDHKRLHHEDHGRSHDDDHKKSRKKSEKPKWGVGQRKKQYVPASKRYVTSTDWKERHETNLKRREEQLLAQQALNNRDRLLATNARKNQPQQPPSSPPVPTLRGHQRHRDRSLSPIRQEEGNIRPRQRTRSPPTNRTRPHSPPVPHVRNKLREEQTYMERTSERPETAMSVTTDNAKYNAYKHTRDSPVPENIDFVEYRRSDVILDPNIPPSRPDTATIQETINRSFHNLDQDKPPEQSKDPLINSDMIKQRERQDKILKEISILRQGLLLKQREVASYPVAMASSDRNLAERMNEINMD